MNIRGSYLGRFGQTGLMISGLLVLGWLLKEYGPWLGINTPKEQFFAGVLIALLVVLLRFLPTIYRSVQARIFRREAQKTNILPADENRLAQRSAPHTAVDNIREAMRSLYGPLWPRKVRILLVTGNVDDVEQLTPKLPRERWQEDQGTLLLWGGDIREEADLAWFTALRKLRRRPIDGVIWVTSAFDDQTESDDASVTGPRSPDAMDALAYALHQRYEALGWRIPLYVWSLHLQSTDQTGRVTQAVGCLLASACSPQSLTAQLSGLTAPLTAQGIQQITHHPRHAFLLHLADRLIRKPESIAGPLAMLLNPYRPLPLAGVLFSAPSSGAARRVRHHWGKDNRWDVLPDSVQTLPAGLRPRRPGVSRQRVLKVAAAMLLALWGGWMALSFITNREQVAVAQTLARLQYRAAHGVPWYERAGLSQNEALLSALLARYGESAQPLLRDAAALHLQKHLSAFTQLPPDSPLREEMAKPAYDWLKLWLMLARPEKMDAAWFADTLMQHWPQRQGVKAARWQEEGAPLLAFYGATLKTHPQWRIHADEALVAQARTLLIRQMGMRNSESSLYQKMLAQVARQYADMRLADMTGDTDAARLFTTDNVVPGMFTRQAWEEAVQPAMDNVVTARREEMDWVLSDSKLPAAPSLSPDALKQRLTARYFADFSSAWLDFLNSLRWQSAATLSDAIDQLSLMADVRQSPLVALMNTLAVQGRTGQTGEALSDSLVKSAKNLFAQDKPPVIDQRAGAHGPLDATFGPVLALLEDKAAGTGNTGLSLQTYLTRVTQVRLRLQQVTNATDPQAMTQALAQTVFQGKAIDLTETRDYGSLVAAGLGQEWNGFGQTVFVRPMEQAWQQVLTPAAESFNAQWRAAVVDDWNSVFGGRYPFKDASSDVSLPLLAKYLDAESGRIARFLQTRLNGVLHKEGSHWVADDINAQGLTFNPAFLQAMDTLSHIADVVFTNGEAGMHFDLRPGTAAGVMQTSLIIDGQKLTYMNQMPVWKRVTWPQDTEAPGASLSWISTQAGTRLYADMSGAWGWIRLLDRASVSAYAGLSSSWNLTWHAPDGRALNYTLRTEAGEGPLALLKLRHFSLPDQLFTVSAPDATDTGREDDGDVMPAAD